MGIMGTDALGLLELPLDYDLDHSNQPTRIQIHFDYLKEFVEMTRM